MSLFPYGELLATESLLRLRNDNCVVLYFASIYLCIALALKVHFAGFSPKWHFPKFANWYFSRMPSPYGGCERDDGCCSVCSWQFQFMSLYSLFMSASGTYTVLLGPQFLFSLDALQRMGNRTQFEGIDMEYPYATFGSS